MKYDLSKMIYYHGEEDNPYERLEDNSKCYWSYEKIFVHQCERKGFTQKQLEAEYPEGIRKICEHIADKMETPEVDKILAEYMEGPASSLGR